MWKSRVIDVKKKKPSYWVRQCGHKNLKEVNEGCLLLLYLVAPQNHLVHDLQHFQVGLEVLEFLVSQVTHKGLSDPWNLKKSQNNIESHFFVMSTLSTDPVKGFGEDITNCSWISRVSIYSLVSWRSWHPRLSWWPTLRVVQSGWYHCTITTLGTWNNGQHRT